MTWYLWVRPVSEPRDIVPDPSGRAVLMFEVSSMNRPSTIVLREIVQFLEEGAVGVFGVDIFITTQPSTKSDYLLLTANGGREDLYRQGTTPPSYQQPVTQIHSVATDYSVAKSRAWQAYYALETIRNRDVVVS